MFGIAAKFYKNCQQSDVKMEGDGPTMLGSSNADQTSDGNQKTFSEIGIISSLNEDFYSVRSEEDDGGEEIDILRAGVPFDFVVGDRVRISGVMVEIGFSSIEKAPNKLEPANVIEARGRVTKKDSAFVVFNDEVFFLSENSTLRLNQECKYVAIATEILAAGILFEWRVLFLKDAMEPENIERLVEMKSVSFSIPRDDTSVVRKFISLDNISHTDILIKGVACDSSNRMIELERFDPDLKLTRGRNRKIRFSLFPRQVGEYKFIFTADFETLPGKEKFMKTAIVDVAVHDVKNILLTNHRESYIPRFRALRMDSYQIPAELRTLNVRNIPVGIAKLRESYPFAVEELKPENYTDKLHLGVFLEEMALEIAFQDYHIEEDRFFAEGDCFKLKVKDVAEKRPSISIGDTVKATKINERAPKQRRIVFCGRIKKVCEDFVLIKFPTNLEPYFAEYEYSIDFEFSRTIYRYQHHAIDAGVSEFGLDFVFPNQIESCHVQIDVELEDGKLMRLGKELKWFDCDLNIYQKAAVVNVLRGECRPLPYILYGPPGTGKTKTLVELIKQTLCLDKASKIIVATPSNSAAYLLTEALTNSGLGREDLIRIISNNQLEKELVPDYLREFCATVGTVEHRSDAEADLEPNRIRKNLGKTDIEKFRICIGTLSLFGTLMHMNFSKKHFSHFFIDEAGQSVEAQSLIPLTLFSKDNCQIVLAGDPKQLGASNTPNIGRVLKTDTSLLERLLTTNDFYAKTHGPDGSEYNPKFVTKLRINYRSLPSVLNVYNKLFYNSELQNAIGPDGNPDAELLEVLEKKILKTSNKCGVYFCNVAKGVNRREKGSSSWFNATEIKAIFSFLASIQRTTDVEFRDIGVITPYALQRQKLKNKINEDLSDCDLKVGTVEEFQGQERQIILVSMVRTEQQLLDFDNKFQLGFLNCPKRMNVCISRARSLLVIFGKAELLQADPYWKELIDYTKENGTFSVDNRI